MEVEERIRSIITEHFLPESVDTIMDTISKRYSEPWRAFHTLKHLDRLFTLCDTDYPLITLCIIYHDIVYYPWRDDNEEASAILFQEHWKQYSKNKNNSILRYVSDLILQTKLHDGADELSRRFNSWDMDVLKGSFDDLLTYEKEVYHEYNHAPTDLYKAGRIDFLSKHKHLNPNIDALIAYVSAFKPRVGYYAGSFNRFHVGHLSIVREARKLFDKVVMVVAQNPDKPELTEEQRETIQKDIFYSVGGIEIVVLPKTEFLPNLLKQSIGMHHPFLIRGIRNVTDWAAESDQAQYMKGIWSDLNIVYLSCPKELEHVSSSGIRLMNKIQEGSGDIYLPDKII